MFSRASFRLHVFPRFLPVICFPALFVGYMFSRASCRLHVFPRFLLVICFPALLAGYMLSRASCRLHIFPRFSPVSHFSSNFRVCCRLLVFPRLKSLIGFFFNLRQWFQNFHLFSVASWKFSCWRQRTLMWTVLRKSSAETIPPCSCLPTFSSLSRLGRTLHHEWCSETTKKRLNVGQIVKKLNHLRF